MSRQTFQPSSGNFGSIVGSKFKNIVALQKLYGVSIQKGQSQIGDTPSLVITGKSHAVSNAFKALQAKNFEICNFYAEKQSKKRDQKLRIKALQEKDGWSRPNKTMPRKRRRAEFEGRDSGFVQKNNFSALAEDNNVVETKYRPKIRTEPKPNFKKIELKGVWGQPKSEKILQKPQELDLTFLNGSKKINWGDEMSDEE